MIGKPVTILIPPDRQDEEPGILERIRRGEGLDHYETVRRRKDGTLFDISLTVSPINDESGRVIGASKIARDITEERRAQDRLQQSEERFHVTLASIGDAVLATDRADIPATTQRRQLARQDRQPELQHAAQACRPAQRGTGF